MWWEPAVVRLPLRVDAEALREELGTLPEGAWLRSFVPVRDGTGDEAQQHAAQPDEPAGEGEELAGRTRRPRMRMTGAALLPLVTPGGEPALGYANAGPVAATQPLGKLPRLQGLLAGLGGEIGRTLLVERREDVPAEEAEGREPPVEPWRRVPRVREAHVHWLHRVCVLVPIVAGDAVRLEVGGETHALEAGSVWAFDPARPHRVLNPSAEPAVHLFASVLPGEALRAMMRGEQPAGSSPVLGSEPVPAEGFELPLEPYALRGPDPDEMARLAEDMLEAARGVYEGEALARVERGLGWLRERWREVYEAVGFDEDVQPAYAPVIVQLGARLPHDFARRLPADSRGAWAYALLGTIFDLATRPLPLIRGGAAARAAGKD